MSNRVASDSVGSDCEKTESESEPLVTRVHPSRVPSSKKKRRGEGELKPSPLSSSSTSPQTQARNPTPAAYAGAVSRFCDLHGLTPDASTGDKAALEFEAFNRYLADLAAERRRVAELKF